MSSPEQPSVITAANIPDWYCADVVDLNAYLTDNPHRTVVRVFARQVTISADIVLQSDLSRPPLDLRIDCQDLHLAANALLDLRGNSEAPLGWKNFARGVPPAAQAAAGPVPPAEPPADGEAGFNGGTLVINALQVTRATGTEQLTLATQGGAGGNGQAGYPGWPGAAGTDGRTGSGHWDTQGGMVFVSNWEVDDPGLAPTDGQPGTDGGPGGAGGAGGTTGSCVVRAAWTDAESPFVSLNAPPQGGAGGTGGAAGTPGGPPGAPAEIYVGNSESYTAVSANQGADGTPGPAGADGPPGTDLAADIQNVPGPQIVAALATDKLPGSLQARCHRLFDAVIQAWALAGEPGGLEQSLGWLDDLAQPSQRDYPDIVMRYAELAALDVETLDIGAQQLRLDPEVFSAAINQLGTVGQPGFSDVRPTLAAVAAHAAAADAERQQSLASLGVSPGDLQSPEDFYGRLASLIAAAAPSSNVTLPAPGPVRLTTLPAVDGIADADTATDGLTASIDDVCVAEADMGPEGVIAAAVTYVFFKCFATFFSDPVAAADAAAARAYQQAVQQRTAELNGWNNAESGRQASEDANNAGWDEWVQRAGQRPVADKRADDVEVPVLFYGTEFVGVLMDVTPADDGSGDVAVFDGMLLPRISDPTALAMYMLATYGSLSFILTVKVPPTSVPVLGEWHAISVEPAAPDDPSSIEPALFFLRPAMQDGSLVMGRGLVLLPGENVSATTIVPADPILSKALNWLFQLNEVANTESTPSGWVMPEGLEVPPPVTSATMFNVRQGTFHVLSGGGGPALAVDMGGSSGSELSPTAIAGMASMAASPFTRVVMSHWDQDHWRALAGVYGLAVQRTNLVAGPSIAITGVTVLNLVRAIAAWGPNHLCLVGSTISNAAHQLGPALRAPTLPPVLAALNLPSNVVLARTTRQAVLDQASERNDCEAFVVRAGTASPLLMPGDASFSVIDPGVKAGVVNLEATHHGSSASIPVPADVPAAPGPNGLVLFSWAPRGTWNHGPNGSFAIYQARGWTQYQDTFNGGAGHDVVVAL